MEKIDRQMAALVVSQMRANLEKKRDILRGALGEVKKAIEALDLVMSLASDNQEKAREVPDAK